MICRFGDVLVVRFPFTDLSIAKPRPAVAISTEAFSTAHDQTILAMVTTGAGSTWPTDVLIEDLPAAGLKHQSLVRWKLFTLTNDQLTVRIGHLAPPDRNRLVTVAGSVLGF